MKIAGLTRPEIYKVVNDYIGVSGGYLGDFSYRSHAEFYPYYCDLDIDPSQYDGTTRERFIWILEGSEPVVQAKILRGIQLRYPTLSTPNRTQESYDYVQNLIFRLEGNQVLADNINTSELVDRALRDAETLIRERGSTSGVDRVHTALHGYLKATCDNANIIYVNESSTTDLLKLLRQQHPALTNLGPQSNELERILRALSTIIDALNPIRNRALFRILILAFWNLMKPHWL